MEGKKGDKAKDKRPRDAWESPVLRDAYAKLLTQEAALQKAALLVQRRWRQRKARKSRLTRADSVFSKLMHMPSREVSAPAYFGESSLWVEFEKWDAEPRMMYSYMAKAMSRGEAVCIPLSAIKDVINHWSPWLLDRFQWFQEAVLEGFRKKLTLEEVTIECPRNTINSDWNSEGRLSQRSGPGEQPPSTSHSRRPSLRSDAASTQPPAEAKPPAPAAQCAAPVDEPPPLPTAMPCPDEEQALQALQSMCDEQQDTR